MVRYLLHYHPLNSGNWRMVLACARTRLRSRELQPAESVNNTHRTIQYLELFFMLAQPYAIARFTCSKCNGRTERVLLAADAAQFKMARRGHIYKEDHHVPFTPS